MDRWSDGRHCSDYLYEVKSATKLEKKQEERCKIENAWINICTKFNVLVWTDDMAGYIVLKPIVFEPDLDLPTVLGILLYQFKDMEEMGGEGGYKISVWRGRGIWGWWWWSSHREDLMSQTSKHWMAMMTHHQSLKLGLKEFDTLVWAKNANVDIVIAIGYNKTSYCPVMIKQGRRLI